MKKILICAALLLAAVHTQAQEINFPVAVAKSSSQRSITLTWDKSTDASVVAYKVYYSYPGITPKVLSLGNVNTIKVSSLSRNKTYTFYVTALSSSSTWESIPSNSIMYATF